MSHREHIDELLADRAIWGLNEDERRDLDALLHAAGERDTDSSWDSTAATITAAYVHWKAVAPDHLLRKLEGDAVRHFVGEHGVKLSQLAATVRGAQLQVVAGEAEPRPPRSSSATPWLVAAAATILAAFVGWGRWSATAPAALSASEQRVALLEEPSLVRIDWSKGPSELSGEASGDVIWSDARQRGFMRFAGLPANDPGQRQYQLWIFDRTRSAEQPVDGGVFDVPAGGGEVVIPIDAKIAVGEGFAFAVTVEKPGGVVVSDREHIVAIAGL